MHDMLGKGAGVQPASHVLWALAPTTDVNLLTPTVGIWLLL